MIANLHTHTFRCNHASGTDKEYVEAAIDKGLSLLGFSDHAPYVFDGDYYSRFRMTHSDTYGYFESIDALREEFSGRIRLLAGFESEYYPKSFSNTLKFWEKFKPEYIILGQHFVVGEGAGMPYSGKATEDEDVLKLYVDTCCEAMRTGLFTYFAHPDLINFVGEGAVYEREIERLIGCCIDTDTPPEINLLGLVEGRAYPRKDFWTLAGKMGATAIIGCDAHIPTRVAVKEEIEAARKLAADSGVLLIDPIDLKLKKVI